jgi:Domain of unknown function (DUF1707)
MTTPPDHDRHMRASDADRVATVRLLQDAVGRGLLTADEGSERMAAAWAAVHVRDLGPLTADLPPVRPVPGAPGWGVLATMATEQLRTSLRGGGSGRLSPARVAAAFAVALLLVVLLGSLVGELVAGGFHEHGGVHEHGGHWR